MRAWIRSHPVRLAVYVLIVTGAVWGALTARGILRGERNALLTRVAQWHWVRGWVEREFHVRYWVNEVGVEPGCGVSVRGAKAELIGAAAGAVAAAHVCLPANVAVDALSVGDAISLRRVSVQWPQKVQGEGFLWRDASGELVVVDGFSASIAGLAGGVEGLRVARVATLRSASAALAAAPGSTVAVKSATANGTAVVVDLVTLAPLPARFQAAIGMLATMASAALPFPAQWSATAHRIVVWVLIGAAVFVLLLKILVTRLPFAPVWRVLAVVAPFPAALLLAWAHSWVAIVVAAPVVALALWAVAYRRALEWQQHWEPAAADVLAVLLALPMLALLSWPAVALPALPVVNRVNVAQFDARDTTAVIRASDCGGSVAQVSIPQAGVTDLQLALDGAKLQSVDIGRASAAGQVQTPPVAFCVSATVHNHGTGDLPGAACSAAVVARASADYQGQTARFAVNWNGQPVAVSASGEASLQGARVDDIRLAAGAPVQIRKAWANATWTGGITAAVEARGVEASGAVIDQAGAQVRAPLPCMAGPTHVTAQAGRVRYASGATHLSLDEAHLVLDRPDSGRVAASISADGLVVKGPVEATLPNTQAQLTGTTSRELIPQTLKGEVGFQTTAAGIGAPVRFEADLASGAWRVENQPLAVWQRITSRVPRSIAIEVQASGTLADARGRVRIPHLVPDIGPAGVELNDLVVDATPLHFSSAWNVLNLTPLPSGFTLNEVSALHLATHGDASEAPAVEPLNLAVPSFPQQTRFRLEGTPQSITILTEGGAPVVIDAVETHGLKAALPGLKLEYLEVETGARVKRAGAEFAVAARSRVTDAATSTTLTAPLAAEASVDADAVRFKLTAPLDTATLLQQVGLTIEGIEPRATISSLEGDATFAGKRLSGFDVKGTLAAGPLAAGKSFEVSADAPALFRVSAPSFPQGTATFSAPGISAELNGGRQRAWMALDASAGFTLSSSPQSAVVAQLIEAAGALGDHGRKATNIFGDAASSAFPVHWDLEIAGGAPTLSLDSERLSLNAKTVVHRLDVGQETIDGIVDLAAGASVADGHLLLNVDAPADIGALGRRWKLDTPLLLALRKQLRPGAGTELFDRAYYQRLGTAPPDAIRVAIGYGDLFEAQAGFHGHLFEAGIDTTAQAAIRWNASNASLDSFATAAFQGLEAGSIALPVPLLEDRLDGELHFATRGFVVDRLLVPQLLADASRVGGLDQVTLSLEVQSARDSGHLPGIFQAATGVKLKPANDFLRLLTDRLSLSLPPRAFQYRRMALDFRVDQGQVRTDDPLLTLQGAQMIGVNGLTVDSNLRAFLGRPGMPRPRLRDLIYTFQRAAGW